MLGALHEHNFVYTADENIIYAHCSIDDCPDGYDDSPLTLTLTPPADLKYDGNNKDQKIINSKYYLLVCYRDANEENWTNFENSFQDLKMSFSNVNNSRGEYIGKEVNINNANASTQCNCLA